MILTHWLPFGGTIKIDFDRSREFPKGRPSTQYTEAIEKLQQYGYFGHVSPITSIPGLENAKKLRFKLIDQQDKGYAICHHCHWNSQCDAFLWLAIMDISQQSANFKYITA